MSAGKPGKTQDLNEPSVKNLIPVLFDRNNGFQKGWRLISSLKGSTYSHGHMKEGFMVDRDNFIQQILDNPKWCAESEAGEAIRINLKWYKSRAVNFEVTCRSKNYRPII